MNAHLNSDSTTRGSAHRRVLLALLSTSAAFALSLNAVSAQTAPAASPSPSPTVPTDGAPPPTAEATVTQAVTQEPESTSTQDIIVTGSRIVRDGYQAPTPMSVIGTEQLATNANANIAQFVTNLPAFAGSASTRSSTTTGSNGSAGVNSLNLRALGANRTLVLLDGHRVTPALSTGVVDVNAIPQILISRVDVVTGGASATYGSDAVAGVVNFVLDRSLTGLKGEVSGGATTYGDGENYKISLAGGTKFADDRGHVVVALEQVHDEGIGANRRDWNRRGVQLLANPAYTATNGQPQRLILGNVGYMTSSPGGVVYSGPLRGTAFGQGGQTYQQNYGDIQADPFMRGGDWEQNDLRRTNAVAPSESRQTAYARANYEVSDALNLYAQGSYVRAKTQADLTTVYMIGSSGPVIQRDNAYLPADVRARMVAAGLSSIRIGTLNRDLGITYQITDRKAQSYQLGGNGKFQMLGGDWQWDAYGQYGVSRNLVTFPTNISRTNYALAVDAVRNPATGAIVCRSTLTSPNNGCSPYNALGFGVNDPDGAAVNFIRSASRSRLKVEQTVLAASLSGEPFSTWAGPVSVALSGEYRKDQAKSVVDAGSLAVDHIYANYTAIDGSTNVKEGAFETIIPLAKKLSWADSWDINGAVRFTSYSLAGNVTTWKLGTTYSPVADLTFRATRSRDIRAPNLQETFLPASTARRSIFDPFTNTTPAFDQTTTGNRNLRPEKADTLGVGAVFTPSFFPGFSASVDYWSIKVADAISIIQPADVLLLCFDGSDPALCNNITRVNGVVSQVISQNINIASEKVRGLDFEASYRSELTGLGLPGSVDLHANFTKYLEDTIDNGVSAPNDFVGEISSIYPPRWRTNVTLGYHLDGLRTSLTARAFASGKQFSNFVECTASCPASTSQNPTVNDNYLPGRVYLDFAISYDLSIGPVKDMSVFFNARNLTNRDPGLTAAGNAFGNGANTAVIYDVDGPVLRAGVRFKL
ncbi:TonB-dependent receptor [Sphingomonas ginsenosidivorax]|uniref:TonB-dependent receptor n=1 Tax=Sphingomonas ginsenosidivorax TaxID=862135 RepID=A0A5C6UF89_9SPHN|nr:TonB-dependent receptor [Sphingomonas ginsenosidivorax]TXC71080.1 TonB-dependent receptor [Sphingomonas ginsenosidivorax]